MGKSSGYGWGIIASLLLHGVLLALLIIGWVPRNRPEPAPPSFIHATLMAETSKSKRAPKPAVKPPPAETREPDPLMEDSEPAKERLEVQRQLEQKRQEELKQNQVAEKKKQQEIEHKRQLDLKQKQLAEEKRKSEEENKKREQARIEQAKKEEQRKREAEKSAAAERRKREQEMADALEREEAEAQAAEEANTNVQSYQDYIRERMERNWSRPLSARNGMVVELTIQLLRNGQVVSVAIAKSSGDPAFDRSAEQAVRKVERFDKLQELPESVYAKNFRRFTLVFRAQDLRL